MQQTTARTSKAGTHTPVKRAGAEVYIFISLTCFGLTVAVTRVCLALTGHPQIGNSVLHFAHALWGGLILFLATLVMLILANGWAFSLSAALSGVGVGLFIDEVGKFITQKSDYFFPPAAPIISGTVRLLAFTMVNLVSFYLSQFGALAAFFSDLATLLVLLAYRAWYLTPPDAATE